MTKTTEVTKPTHCELCFCSWCECVEEEFVINGVKKILVKVGC